MAIGCTRLRASVTATVIESFRSLSEGEQVVINRVAGQALMFGVDGQLAFLPPDNVDAQAREEIVRRYKAVVSEGS